MTVTESDSVVDDSVTGIATVLHMPVDLGPVSDRDIAEADRVAAQLDRQSRGEDAPPRRPRADGVGRALVVIVDDRAAHGEDQSLLGPLVGELLMEAGFHVDAAVAVGADEVEVRNALNTAVIGGVDVVISIGGVGVGPRDVTPEATEGLLDKRIAGIEEAIRSSGLAAGAADAGLSRGLAGISGQTLVVNLANSRSAVRDGMATVTPLAKRVIESISDIELA